MANERQAAVVIETRAVAGRIDEAINDLEEVQARFDVLNLETPNFQAGYFGTTQEITYNALLGAYNALAALKAAAPSQWNALRAALRTIRG